MEILAILISVLAISWSCVSGFPSRSRFNQLIVGGVEVCEQICEETSRNEFPYQISLQHSYYGHFCGGLILNNYHVLTTAHCAEMYSVSYLVVVAGEHNLVAPEGTEQERPVATVIRHPSYNPGTFANDIAVLRLRSALTFNNAVQPVELAPASSSTPSGSGIVTGWGRTTEGGSSSSVLRKVTVPFVSDTICKLIYGSALRDTMLCAGESGKDACQGDSGGGLVTGSANSRVAHGLVSWGIGCGRPSLPGVYTRISSFRSWISQNTAVEGVDYVSE